MFGGKVRPQERIRASRKVTIDARMEGECGQVVEPRAPGHLTPVMDSVLRRQTCEGGVGGVRRSSCKRSIDEVVVEIGGNRQSCEPSTILLFKLVLEVIFGARGCCQ